jgi:hypothetical protein
MSTTPTVKLSLADLYEERHKDALALQGVLTEDINDATQRLEADRTGSCRRELVRVIFAALNTTT